MNKYEFEIKINNNGMLEPTNNDMKILLLQDLKQGKSYKCKLSNSRNIKHLAKYWLLMKALAFHFPKASDNDIAWHEYFKFKFLPHIEFQSKNGILKFPSSIAFDKMSQIEFDEFYNKIENHLVEQGYQINELIETMLI